MRIESVRPPAVAGTFYPGEEMALRDCVAEMLTGATPQQALPGMKALIVPHAGYIYSGPVAASGYTQLAPVADAVRRVVLLGPAHRVGFEGIALPGVRAFVTPLGNVALDPEAEELPARFAQVIEFPAAHAREHSLEVQLPFLQVMFKKFTLLPLLVGDADAAAVAEVIETLWDGPGTFFIISSDLSHYLPYAAARAQDLETARQILRLDATLTPDQACGAFPVNGMLLAARRRGLTAVQLDLRNSGDTEGDRQRVVGYGAFAFLPDAREPHG